MSVDSDREDDAFINNVDENNEVKSEDILKFDDDVDAIEFIEILSIVEVRSRSSMRTRKFSWKGVVWDILVRVQNTEFQAYMGFDGVNAPPSTWTKHLVLNFSVYTLDGERLATYDEPLAYFFRANGSERVDQGRTAFISDTKIRANTMAPEHLFRLKLDVYEKFSPAVAPVNYNGKEVTGMVGLENLGATCYLNALLQMLFHINSFRKAVYQLPHLAEGIITSSTTLALQSVFKNLQYSNKEVTTKILTAAFGWSTVESFTQQDVQEMMRVLLDKLEEKMKGTTVDGYIKYLFAGTVRSFVRCVNVRYESKRDEDFYDIQLDVKGCKNVYESFEKYTMTELLDGDNQYDAGVHGKQDAQKGITFIKFPPVLTVHLKRFEFDFQMMGFTKIHDHFEFPKVLELDKYLAEDCPPEAKVIKNRYHLHSVLVHSGDVGGGHYYAYIRPFRGQDAVASNVNATNIAPNAAAVAAAGTPTAPMKVSTEPKDWTTGVNNAEATSPATATGTGITVGSINAAAAASSSKRCKWFKFNDETVLEVKEREAIENCYGRAIPVPGEYPNYMYKGSFSSAYMLVYVRESEASEIMKEVTDSDVPKDLIAHLNSEVRARKQAERKDQFDNMMIPIKFATENHIRTFHDYSKADPFINDKHFSTMFVMKGSTNLGLLLLLAQHCEVLPTDIRLWILEREKTKTGNFGPWKALKDLFPDDLTSNDDSSMLSKTSAYYIQRRALNDQQKAMRDDLAAKFAALRTQEENWLINLRCALFENPDGYEYSSDEDPVRGCGIGMGNIPLHVFLQFANADAASALLLELTEMTILALNLLKECNAHETDTFDCMITVKVFDPANVTSFSLTDDLTISGVDASKNGSGSENDNNSDTDSQNLQQEQGQMRMVPTSPDAAAATAADTTTTATAAAAAGEAASSSSSSSNAAAKSSKRQRAKDDGSDFPIVKYAGYLLLSHNGITAAQLIQSLQEMAIKNCTKVEGRQYIKSLKGVIHWDSSTKLTPMQYKNHSTGEELPAKLYFSRNQHHMIIVLSPVTSAGNNVASAGFAEWITNRASSRQLMLNPFNERDAEIVKRLRQAQNKKKSTNEGVKGGGVSPANAAADTMNKLAFDPTMNSDGAINDVLGGNVSNRKRTLSNSSDATGNNQTHGDNDGTISSGDGNDKMPLSSSTAATVASSVASASASASASATMANSASPSALASVSTNEDTDISISFSTTVNLADNMREVCKKVAKMLGVNANMVSFYFLPHGGLEHADPDEVTSVAPAMWSTISPLVTLEKYLNNIGAQTKRLTCFALYRIHPFPTEDNNGNAKENNWEYKYCSFLLLGQSLRYWRKGFMRHIAEEEEESDNELSNGNSKRLKSTEDRSSTVAFPVAQVPLNNTTGGGISYNKIHSTVALNNPQIKWPADIRKFKIHDMLDPVFVYCRVARKTTVVDIIQQLKNIIGIPENIEEFLEPEEIFQDAGINLQKLSEIMNSCGDDAQRSVVSEHCQALQRKDKSIAITPSYPVALLYLRSNIISEVVPGNVVRGPPDAWLTAMMSIDSYYQYGVQHVTQNSLLFMKGLHPKIRSTLVSVYNFTLYGNKVQPCEIHLFCGPFISYIREDDDYASLCARFGKITGDDDWDRCRLAVVSKSVTPVYLPRQSGGVRSVPSATNLMASAAEMSINGAAAAAAGGGGGTTLKADASDVSYPIVAPSGQNSIWDILVSEYPAYQHCAYSTEARKDDIRNIPTIGIQRSVSDVAGLAGGSKRRGGGIKIS